MTIGRGDLNQQQIKQNLNQHSDTGCLHGKWQKDLLHQNDRPFIQLNLLCIHNYQARAERTVFSIDFILCNLNVMLKWESDIGIQCTLSSVDSCTHHKINDSVIAKLVLYSHACQLTQLSSVFSNSGNHRQCFFSNSYRPILTRKNKCSQFKYKNILENTFVALLKSEKVIKSKGTL